MLRLIFITIVSSSLGVNPALAIQDDDYDPYYLSANELLADEFVRIARMATT